MKLIDVDNIDLNDIPCVCEDTVRLDHVQHYIDKQSELTASQMLEYVDKCNSKIYVVSIGEYSDKSNIYATTNKEAAELFVKKYNFNRTYGKARFVRIYFTVRGSCKLIRQYFNYVKEEKRLACMDSW